MVACLKNRGDVAIRRIDVGVTGGDSTGLSRKGYFQMGLIRDFFGEDESDTDIASAGNGGVATASANGGAVSLGDVNSGGNAGNAIGVGDTVGTVGVDGGSIANLTDIGVSANGGTAIADASGGDYNLAFVS
jgi:hypothetical protein